MGFWRICLSIILGLAGMGALQAGPAVGQFHSDTSFFVTGDAAETTRYKLELIRNAKQSVELSANYAGGRDYREALQLMAAAMERDPNFRVYLIFETVLMDSEDKRLTHELKAKYPNQFHAVEESKSTEIIDKGVVVANHMKILVVDEKYFVVGGTSMEQSLSTEGLSPEPSRPRDSVPEWAAYNGARDMDIVGVGPMAQTLRRVFYTTHARFEQLVLTGQLETSDEALAPHNQYRPIDPSRVAVVASVDQHAELIRGAPMKLTLGGPYGQLEGRISQEYVRLIEGARQSIDIGNLLFIPPQNVLTALMDAGNRNVAISVITNGIHNRSPFPTTLFGWGSRYNYFPTLVGVELEGPDYFFADEIPSNNVQIHEYYVEQILYHKKVMVIDGKTLVIGSYNLGRKSELGDYELALTIESPAAAQKVIKVLEIDRAHSRAVSRSEATDYYFSPIWSPVGKAQQEMGRFEL
jgi:phosphatidylserine/phosphatidylglycerophosphate/cardiolipin synthase-like enzyme